MNRTELKCFKCGYDNQIVLYQPSWVPLEVVSASPSCLYHDQYKLNDLIQINRLLGEQNEILKTIILSLNDYIKSLDKKNLECIESPNQDKIK